MLEIVDQQEEWVAAEPGDKLGEERPATSPMDVEAIGDCCRNERRVEHRGQRDERDTLRHRGAGSRCHGQGQPRFADPAWTREGDQPHIVAPSRPSMTEVSRSRPINAFSGAGT